MTDRPMREISIEGCEVLGKGGNGIVYKLDPETIRSILANATVWKKSIKTGK